MSKERKIKVIPGFSGYKQDTLCFKTSASTEDVYNFEQFAFEDGPGLMAPSALRLLYERMLLGSPFPGTLIVNQVTSFQVVVAAALFIDPSLVYEERCSSLVYALDLISRVGDVGLAHVPLEHSELIDEILGMLHDMPSNTLEDEYNRLHSGASLVSEYLRHGALGFAVDQGKARSFDVVDAHDDFAVVVSDSTRSIFDLVYRDGFLCGVCFPEDSSKPVLFKKSSLVPYFNLSKVAQLLDKREFGVSVSSAGWMENFDPAMVSYPTKDPTDGSECAGTSLSENTIIEIAKSIYKEGRRDL